MATESPSPLPLLDHRSIWPSHRKIEEDGTLWSDDPPVGVKLTVEPARKSEVFFTAQRPWEQDARIQINTVIYEGGRFRLWYGISRAVDAGGNLTCYAESGDGFEWERPELGFVEFEGSTKNNIISADEHFLQTVFIDPNAPPGNNCDALVPSTEGRSHLDIEGGQPLANRPSNNLRHRAGRRTDTPAPPSQIARRLSPAAPSVSALPVARQPPS